MRFVSDLCAKLTKKQVLLRKLCFSAVCTVQCTRGRHQPDTLCLWSLRGAFTTITV